MSPTWLKTRPASDALGCSPEHLKRQRDIYGGFLEAGVHYITSWGAVLQLRLPGMLRSVVLLFTAVVKKCDLRVHS